MEKRMHDKHRLTQAIDTYCAAWNEEAPEPRLVRLGQACTDDVIYQDPDAHTAGLAALSDHIGKVRQAYPGGTIARTSLVDVHHHVCRFGWQMRWPDGRTLPEGHDFVDLSPDGRICRVSGFFGLPRPLSSDRDRTA